VPKPERRVSLSEPRPKIEKLHEGGGISFNNIRRKTAVGPKTFLRERQANGQAEGEIKVFAPGSNETGEQGGLAGKRVGEGGLFKPG